MMIGECSVKVRGKQSSMGQWGVAGLYLGLIAITRRGFSSH